MSNLAIIRAFLQERLDVNPEQVIPEAKLENLGMDSLMLLELMFEFEEKLNVTLSRNIATPRTVAELLAIVEGLQNARPAD